MATNVKEQRILDVAIREFAEKGYAGARMEHIAQRAGVNKQLLNYYFKNKEGLYDAVLAPLADVSQTVNDRLSSAVAREGYADAVIGRVTVKERKRWQVWRRLLTSEALERGHVRIRREEERREGWRRSVDLIREAQERGEIDGRFDPEMLMVAIAGILQYPYLLPQTVKLITESEPMDEQFIERQIDFLQQFFAILRPRRDGGSE
jgi:AcrR family transcriptional regulator